MPKASHFTLAVALLALGALSAVSRPSQSRDYFTELEISDIQMAQEIPDRTTVLLLIAERRLVELNPPDPEEEDNDDGRGFGATIGDTIFRVLNPEGAAELEAIDEARAALDDDLSGDTRADLLRGYVQALEETMDNIDDAYERNRGDVKDPIEALRDFAQAGLDTLQHLESGSDGEARALDDAIEQTELVINGSEAALEMISN